MQIVFRPYSDMPKHQRLKTARIRAGFKTARDAALNLGIPYGTYSGHEAGSRGIKDEELIKYAQTFRVPVTWLQFGSTADEPRSKSFSIIDGIAGKMANGEVEFFGNSQIELMPFDIAGGISDPAGNTHGGGSRLPMPRFMAPAMNEFRDLISIKIEGNKLIKKWEPGSVLYFQKEKYEDIDGYSKFDCICWLDDGSAIIDKPLVQNVYGKSIKAVSPLIIYLTYAGMSSWLESLAAAFMQAAESAEP